MSHRTQITLTDAQYRRLKQESARTGLGLAQLVRHALDATYFRPSGDDAQDVLNASFGAWNGRELDGEAYVDAVRPGMARRLSRP